MGAKPPGSDRLQPTPPRNDRLDSWKEIANYLGKAVSTIQRWEVEENLPVHRHEHGKLGSVYAFKPQLDEWLRSRTRFARSPELSGQRAASARAAESPAPLPESTVPQIPRDTVPRGHSFRALTRNSLVILGVAILGVAAGRVWSRFDPKDPQPMKVLPLTTYSGLESFPSLSPDGGKLAFVWNSEQHDNFDIYLQEVNNGPPLRLTTDSQVDSHPTWSPSGRQIAFTRQAAGALEIYVMEPGAPERKVAAVRRSAHGLANETETLAWTSDGKWLAIADRDSEAEPFSLFLLSAATGQRRRLTFPPPGARGDVQSAFSPDGKLVAFARYVTGSEADLYVQPLEGGEPRRLTSDRCWIRGLQWTPDGRELIYSSNRNAGGMSLWRLAVASGSRQKPALVAGIEGGAVLPSLSYGAPSNPARLPPEVRQTVKTLFAVR